MKKIGILTYHNTTNYGALLQAFALQRKLIELGACAEIINYHSKKIEEREQFVFPKFDANIINYLHRIKSYYNVSKKRKKMNHFIKNNLIISKKSYTMDSINEANKIYDIFIVGSDMVFAPSINGGDMTYYLDFADSVKRYSYAASLGVDKIDDNYLNKCIDELKKFQHISIREKEGREYFSKILNEKVFCDIDPTLLYDGSFWEKYEIIPKDKIKKGYVLLYFMTNDMPEFDIACKLAADRDLDVYILSNNRKKISGCNVIFDASVGEFLYYIHHADLVITASFHGLIFSINYNTNFMFFCNNNGSSRLRNIAEITGFGDREITFGKVPDFECNFNIANKELKKMREKSLEYLKSIVEN